MSICDNIAALRERAHLTQRQVADSLGITPAAISKWESGINEPSASNLIEMSKLFGCEISDFYKTDSLLPEGPVVCVLKNQDTGKIKVFDAEGNLERTIHSANTYCGSDMEIIAIRRMKSRLDAMNFVWRLQYALKNDCVVINGMTSNWFYEYAEHAVLFALENMDGQMKEMDDTEKPEIFCESALKNIPEKVVQKVFVYFIENVETRKIKIGITDDLKRRVSSLKNGAGADLEVIGTITVGTRDDARRIEGNLHKRFSKHRQHAGEMITEWFDGCIKPDVLKILEASA